MILQESLFPLIDIDADLDTKLNHDRYEVYVNGDFIGVKPLLLRNEQIGDLNDFLQEQGFHQFTSGCDGDHYDIKTDQDNHQMKEALQMHLQNR